MDSEDVWRELLKDGGRLVMYGGDPYEDDLEPAEPPPPGQLPRTRRGNNDYRAGGRPPQRGRGAGP